MGGCSDDAFDYFRGWLIGLELLLTIPLDDHICLTAQLNSKTLSVPLLKPPN
jgi:hypothetical protein